MEGIRSCVAVALMAAATAAYAQDATQAPAETPATIPVEPVREEAGSTVPAESTGTQRLDDVVVTATKRVETERDVPISIDSLKGKDLEQGGATGLEQILQFSPGVNINKGASADTNYVSIRGVSSDSRNNIYSRPTGIFLDDTSLTNPSLLSVLADVDPFDLSRVEILKGPQGTLFGGSALSGAVRYLPNQPDLAGTHFKLLVGEGRMEDSEQKPKTYAAMLNLPMGESFGLRAAGIHRKNAGFLDNTKTGVVDFNSSEIEQARAAVLWQPISELKLQASYFWRTVSAPGGNSINDVENRSVSNSSSPTPTESEVGLPDFRLEWDFGSSTLVALYSRLKIDGMNQVDLAPGLGLDSTPVEAYQPYTSSVDQPAYELRLVSNEPSEWGWEYLAGLFYTRSEQSLSTYTTINALGENADLLPAALVDLLQQTINDLGIPLRSLSSVSSDVYIDALATEKAAYFDLTKTLFEDWKLGLGGRYYDQVTDGIARGGVSGIPYTDYIPAGTPLSNAVVHQTEKGFNPKASLTWKPSDEFSIYASAAKGFRFGGINTTGSILGTALNIPLTFKSDHLWNYEAGVRTDWFDGRLIADLTGFYIDWTDLQILQLKGGIAAYTDNVGGARSKGAELDLKALLPWNFFVSLGGAYVDAYTTEVFQDADGNDIQPGAQLPASPKYSASGILSHNGELFGVNIQTLYSVTYRGESPNSLQNDIPLPAYVLHNASINLGLRQFELQPEINLSVTNLLDEKTKVFALNAPGGELAVTNQPRTLLLTFSLTY